VLVVTANTDRYYGCYSNGDVSYTDMENTTHKQVEVQEKFGISHGFTQFTRFVITKYTEEVFAGHVVRTGEIRTVYRIFEGRLL